EDGTFKIEFDEKEMIIMPSWHGVPPEEISFDDARLWPSVFAQLSPEGRPFSRANFPSMLATLGYPMDADQAHSLWDQVCEKLFQGQTAPTQSLALDETTVYQFLVNLGMSAKLCVGNLQTEPRKLYFKLYWNQLRMGGRNPAEVRRPVTLDDAF